MAVLAAEPRFSTHLLQRTVVLPDLRVLFVPVPKAGCTSVLWLLAELAGIADERFASSPLPEVSPALTVHDMSLWEGMRLADYDGPERRRVLSEEGWLRFSLVREPRRRLWSAWQSKLLLREPRFVEAFGSEPWFPRIPSEPSDLVVDFRRFVSALPGGRAEDVHWGVQHELVGQLPLDHVGRVERLDETLARLRAHLPADRRPVGVQRENRSRIPMPPDAYDEPAAAVVRERYARDFAAYWYDANPAPSGEYANAWEHRVAPLLPALQDAIEQNARIGQLHRLARRPRPVEPKPAIANREGHPGFHVRWGWADGVTPGFTAVLRIRDEAPSLPWVLPPLLRAVSRVVMVDNGSTDGSVAVARRVAAEAGAADRLDVHSYPFAVARCGPEHLATPADSVQSLTHFYNWSFSHVRTAYALKWDGDMVLTEAAVAALRELAWQLEGCEAVVKIPRHSLYVETGGRAYLDTGLRNCEPWAWPNRPGYSFAKALEWELPMWQEPIETVTLPDWSCFELKHLDADEFAHWSHTAFATSARTQRKRREWEVFHALGEHGRLPAGVEAVAAPAGVHVVDYVRSAYAARAAAA